MCVSTCPRSTPPQAIVRTYQYDYRQHASTLHRVAFIIADIRFVLASNKIAAGPGLFRVPRSPSARPPIDSRLDFFSTHADARPKRNFCPTTRSVHDSVRCGEVPYLVLHTTCRLRLRRSVALQDSVNNAKQYLLLCRRPLSFLPFFLSLTCVANPGCGAHIQ